jgi:hypothetical protein
MIEDDPSIGAIVCECTNITPYSHDLVRELGVPVFDMVTLVHWFTARCGRSVSAGLSAAAATDRRPHAQARRSGVQPDRNPGSLRLAGSVPSLTVQEILARRVGAIVIRIVAPRHIANARQDLLVAHERVDAGEREHAGHGIVVPGDVRPAYVGEQVIAAPEAGRDGDRGRRQCPAVGIGKPYGRRKRAASWLLTNSALAATLKSAQNLNMLTPSGAPRFKKAGCLTGLFRTPGAPMARLRA